MIDEQQAVNDMSSALIIDDELDLCMMIKKFFTRKNNEVDYSTSLKDGFRKFEKHQPDILILDHNLPDGFGIGSIGKFKSMLHKPLYIVVMSAMSNLRAVAIESGADDFIDKPVTFSKLNEILRHKH